MKGYGLLARADREIDPRGPLVTYFMHAHVRLLPQSRPPNHQDAPDMSGSMKLRMLKANRRGGEAYRHFETICRSQFPAASCPPKLKSAGFIQRRQQRQIPQA